MNLFEKQNKPFAIKLSDRVKEEIKKEFGSDLELQTLTNYIYYIDNDNWIECFNIPKQVALITEAEFFGDGNNKLREKIKSLVPIEFGGMDENLANQLEQINDDFAAEFARWLNRSVKANILAESGCNYGELLQIFKTKHYE